MKKIGKKPKPIFAKNIVSMRKSLGWNAHELAEKAGIPYPTLRDIEAGYNHGREETRAAIAKALGCEMADLYVDIGKSAASQPQALLDWRLLSRVLENYLAARPERQLLARYILTDDESFLEEFENLPDAPQIVSALKKTL